MSPIEQALHDLLRDLRDEPAPAAPGGLADVALHRARRRGRTRAALATTSAALAACLVVAGVGVAAARSSGDGPAQPASGLSSAGPDGSADGRSGDGPWAGRTRVNVLVVGSDAGPGRSGTRADTIVVASTDPRSGDTLLVGLPRNLQRVPFPPGSRAAQAFPSGFSCVDAAAGTNTSCLLGTLWQWAEDNAARYYPGVDDPGLTATRQAVELLTGLRLDEHVVLTTQGLARLVDAVGGVRVDVARRLPVGGSTGNPVATEWIEAGENQLLDGYHAAWFARSRWSTSDYDRMGRQRCLLAALAQQVDGTTLARNWPKVARALRDEMQTSVAATDLPAWAGLAGRVRNGTMRSLVLTDEVVSTARPDVARIRAQVASGLRPDGRDPAVQDVRSTC